MDALLPALVVALIAELGDRTQWLAMLLGDRYRRPAAVLVGIALAAAVNMAAAAAAGIASAALVDHRAIRALIGLALLLAGIGAFFRAKAPPPIDGWKLGTFASSFGAFSILQFGDKTQFAAMAIAAGSGSPWLAAIGATLGVTIANIPAVVLGERWRTIAPLHAIRIGAGVVLALAGFGIGASAIGIV